MKFGLFSLSSVPETAQYGCILVQLIDIQQVESNSLAYYD